MLKLIAIAAVLLVGGVLVAAAMRPDTFRVQRTASIKAPAEKIFPNLKGSYSGADSGKGAAYAFQGNKDVGKGSLEITDSSPASKVTMSLNMLEPFEARNVVEFILEPKGDATNVTWAMQGHTPYLGKIIHLFFDMDGMVGRDFEAGLANLKAIAER